MGPKTVATASAKTTPGAKPSRGSVGPATKPKVTASSSTPAATAPNPAEASSSNEPPKAEDETIKTETVAEQQQSENGSTSLVEESTRATPAQAEVVESKDETHREQEGTESLNADSGATKVEEQESSPCEEATTTGAEAAGGTNQEPAFRDERSVSPAASEPAILSVPPLPSTSAVFTQRAPSRELVPTEEAIQIASMTVALGVEGLLHPLNSAIRETAESQRAMREYLAEASRRQRRINETLATVEPTFAKLPRYIEKLALMKKNLDTLEYNVKKIRKNACDVKSEVDEVLAPKLHPVQKK
jgi:hypothetical protein